MNGNGFILLHRKITEWEWYQNPNTFRVFLHCLLMANYTDGRFEGKEIKRGQFVTSLPSLSDQTSLSIRQVRVALDHLIMTGELTNKSYTKYRVITVVKYDQYQSNDRQIDSQMTDKRQTNDSQMTDKRQQYNNNNKNNNDKKNNNELFDRFWSVYPRKVGKENARKAFAKVNPDETLLNTMIEAVVKQSKCDQWIRDGGQYIPHPATWINGHRWEDEVSVRTTGRVLPAQDFQQRDYSGVQKEIEDEQKKHVIEMLCKNHGLWDEVNSRPVDGWRAKLDAMKEGAG